MVTPWTGRSPADAPADLRSALFKADSPGETTYFIILDAAGRVHRVIPGGTMRDGRAKEATAYVKEQLEKVATELKLSRANVKPRDVRLPDVEPANERRAAPVGVRIFVRLPDHERAAYRAPVVKAVTLTEMEWSSLAFPKTTREVPADALKTWMADVFPPAMKEMVGPNIQNEEINGTLKLESAGTDKSFRYAVLSGEVQLVLAGRTKVTHTGKLEMLLTYPLDSEVVGAMRGIYEGIYPETDPRQNRITSRKFVAAIESRPK